jgi:hypothetical protein
MKRGKLKTSRGFIRMWGSKKEWVHVQGYRRGDRERQRELVLSNGTMQWRLLPKHQPRGRYVIIESMWLR